MKKYIIALISLFFLTACVFRNIPEYEFTAKNYVNDKFFITAQLVNSQNENSPLDFIWLHDRRYSLNTPHKIKILSKKIKVVNNNKEYIVSPIPTTEVIVFYRNRIEITDSFKIYIGKIQLDDGTIIEIPPLLFEKTKKSKK